MSGIKHHLGLALVLVAAISSAYAAVDVNTGNEAALESISGIGASKARAIVREREANGPYKDADDLATRISGLGTKSIERLKQNNLTIGGGGSGGGNAGSTPSSVAAPSAAASAKATKSAKAARK